MGDRKGEPLGVQSLAAEGREGFKKSDLGARLERYGRAKINALQFADYLSNQADATNKFASELLDLAESIRDCGNYAVFRDYYTIGQTRLARFCTCKKHLVCPLCAIRRGAKALRIYLARVKELMSSDPLLRPYMVTLTVKNGSDLDERYRHLTNSLRNYHKQRRAAIDGRRSPVEANKASAAVWSVEFKIGRNSGEWHPHVHAIWMCREAPDAAALSREWFAATGDSFIVDARPMTADDEGSYVSGFCEVFKYALKFSDMPYDERLHAYRTLKGRRLQDSMGDLRGLKVDPDATDDLLEDLPYIERLYVFTTGAKLEYSAYIERSATHCDNRDSIERQIAHLVELGWSDDKILAYCREHGFASETEEAAA